MAAVNLASSLPSMSEYSHPADLADAIHMMGQMSTHCRLLAHPHWFPVALATCLVVGIVFSYIPQLARIVHRRSSDGLSPWWVLLGGLSGIAAVGNIVTLPTSRADMACCKELSGGDCAAAFLGVIQIGCQWLCFMFIVVLYIVYFSHETTEVQDLTVSTGSLTKTSPAKRYDPLIVGCVTFTSLLVVGIVSAVLVSSFPNRTQEWANFLGVAASIMAAIQYIPQIYTTWTLKDAKSLSIVTMSIQVPGAVVFSTSLFLRVGWQGWSTWSIYLLTACLQAVVLALAITYSIQNRRETEAAPTAQSIDERTALLNEERT